MVPWLDEEGDTMRIAFTRVFGSKWKQFGTRTAQSGGYSSTHEGVQWQVGYDAGEQRHWVGINLEGMQYNEWPIARLLERELKEPTLPKLVQQRAQLRSMRLLLQREYRNGVSRPEIQERDIAPTPIALGSLASSDWLAALTEARNCLDSKRKRRGRARQLVTLVSGARVEGEVAPHLMFRYDATERAALEDFYRKARADMEPLYKWTVDRAAQLVSF